MIVEVNEAGQILIPAEFMLAAPHTRFTADRDGDAVILRPITGPIVQANCAVDSLLTLEGQFSDPGMTFRRDESAPEICLSDSLEGLVGTIDSLPGVPRAPGHPSPTSSPQKWRGKGLSGRERSR